MSTATRDLTRTTRRVVYPERDGKRMADNTLQFRWITTLKEGCETLLRNRPDVFVAGDLLWYPVEDDNKTRRAPDVLVAFGRPKGERGSYLQWKEGGISPQVVVEVMSPGNRADEMARKLRFYDQFGVEEYYIYDPDRGRLAGWLRSQGSLREIAEMRGFVSPRLGTRFDLVGMDLEVVGPDGERFLSYQELVDQRECERARAEQERVRAEQQRARAEQEHVRAEQERARAEQEHVRANLANERAEMLASQLRALGVKPKD